MKFRYDIGFLRALAVLVVVLFHYKIPHFDGGFTGVDVFSVIGGFLMTSIVLKGFNVNSCSLNTFHLKKIYQNSSCIVDSDDRCSWCNFLSAFSYRL